MNIALGLTGVPPLSSTGKPLDELFDSMHKRNTPPPPYALHYPQIHYTLPLTPEASPAQWERDSSCCPTPLGHVSATHPPDAPLHGLGLSPSMFEQDLPRITISAARPLYHDEKSDMATPQITRSLSQPPFNKTRQKQSSISLPKFTEHSGLFSPGGHSGPQSLGSRRRRSQLYRRIVWVIFSSLVMYLTYREIANSTWLATWKKRNAQWSAHIQQSHKDSLYGLEEDFVPTYFHRTQRHQYIQYISRDLAPEATGVSSEPRTFNEVESNVFDEDDLAENQDAFFSATTSDVESAAISRQIDNMLSSPEVEAYIFRHTGNLRGLYLEGLSALAAHDTDSVLALSQEAILPLLHHVDANRRQFLKALVRFLGKGGQLPEEWQTETTFESLMLRIWTSSPDSKAISQMFADESTPGDAQQIFDAGWEQEEEDRADVTVFTKGKSPRLLRLKELLRSYKTVHPVYINMAQRADAPIIESLLRRLTGYDAVPHVLVGFESIGGWNQVMVLQSEGVLQWKLTRRR